MEALNHLHARRSAELFPACDRQVSRCYGSGDQRSLYGALNEDKERISEILKETWEGADDWFVHDLS
ncbi:DinI-like family protein [Klebsiella pneumoniae]|uniref:DinI-like family protein n=1 Tax=Klebsiella pneumoniae TaxID=573 RepID=UPI00210C44D5|nr:DinI-like family protein [Klebsiella pneumoniae]